MSYVQISTSAEVWAVIKARHGKALVVFESFSDPDGTFNGGAGECGRMVTAYGFNSAREPIIKAQTRWKIDPENPHNRIDETHDYWLCVAQRGESDEQ
jgi:hypothetical protein